MKTKYLSKALPILFTLTTATTFVTCTQKKEAEQTTASADSVQSVSSASTETKSVANVPDPASIPASKIASKETILARPQVPILCYHQIRDWLPRDSQDARSYIVPLQKFKEQIKMLADSGYHTILPDQLYAYLTTGAALPAKPIMITFDDGDEEQYDLGAPELEKYGFKGVFFIMTTSIGRKGFKHYMDSKQIKELSDRGHVIGAHTWDHHNVKKYQGEDWVTQVEKPNKKLMEITGKPVRYFAYPFGLWNEQAVPELKKRGYLQAFQLAERKRSDQDPLLTIRRIIASGYWTPKTLYNNMIGTFKS